MYLSAAESSRGGTAGGRSPLYRDSAAAGIPFHCAGASGCGTKRAVRARTGGSVSTSTDRHVPMEGIRRDCAPGFSRRVVDQTGADGEGAGGCARRKGAGVIGGASLQTAQGGPVGSIPRAGAGG